MNAQSLATAVLLLPAVVFGVVAWRARRDGRTSFGFGFRSGAVGEFLRGMLFSMPFLAVLLLLYVLTGSSRMNLVDGDVGEVIVVWVYFFVLFLIEEIVFRGVLMTGLGVVWGQTAALIITAVLVAAPYALNPEAGVLPVFGAVVANLLHGWARWRSGRIWWGLGQRWVWNSAIVTMGFANSAFFLSGPFVSQDLQGPRWLSGGSFGVEGGIIGITLLVAMLVTATRFARGSQGPWQITPPTPGEPDSPR